CTFVGTGTPCTDGVCDGAGSCVPSGSAECGNGVVEPGEECDDGAANGQPGDCCSPSCLFQAAGPARSDDGALCTQDACAAAGAWGHGVVSATTCMAPQSQGASLLMRIGALGKSQTRLDWGKSPAVGLGAYGDPVAGDALRLCIYEAVDADTYALVFA